MGAPNLTFSISGEKVSGVSGFDHIVVSFQADADYPAFECRATKAGEDWGLGKGVLVASFSTTPANTQRTFEIYDDLIQAAKSSREDCLKVLDLLPLPNRQVAQFLFDLFCCYLDHPENLLMPSSCGICIAPSIIRR